MDESLRETKTEAASNLCPQTQVKESEIKSRVDSVWEKMNKGVSTKTLNSIVNKHSPTGNKTLQKTEVSHNWMSFLGMAPKKTQENGSPQANSTSQANSTALGENGTSDESKKLAATALAAAKAAANASVVGRGKIEVTEIRDFAGEEIEVKKLIDPNSKEATDKAGSTSAVDSILEQIKKKPKLNLLDKTKKDWGEFKGENQGLEDELDAYKKSSNQYLDRVSFLNRADYREFERERDARLQQQAKRRLETREDP